MPRFELRYESAYLEDLQAIHSAYDLPPIREAVLQLADQADVVARNRRRLGRTISWCPDATWQARVRDYRVLYRVDEGVVSLLRVRFKGTKTTEEMGR
jgi:mRNA-degrading endonuclease RelE of RelBE toxin-antitoxin system